jgi:hypothetical protein
MRTGALKTVLGNVPSVPGFIPGFIHTIDFYNRK